MPPPRPPIRTLDQSSLRTLQDVVNWWRKHNGPPPPGPPPGREYADDHQGPEFYVAFTPGAGIPAVDTNSTTGTGTSPYDDTISSAVCHIYKVIEVSGSKRFRKAGFTRRVYNPHRTNIDGWRIVPVARDKYGVWWALQGGTGTSTSGDEVDIGQPASTGATPPRPKLRDYQLVDYNLTTDDFDLGDYVWVRDANE